MNFAQNPEIKVGKIVENLCFIAFMLENTIKTKYTIAISQQKPKNSKKAEGEKKGDYKYEQ